jgi:XRE family transcriptional regulator, regulator of sulfur utilization
MTTQQSFGQLVRKYRHKRGVTLPELAIMSCVSKGLLSKIESGKGNPTLTTIEKLAKALRVTFEISG